MSTKKSASADFLVLKITPPFLLILGNSKRLTFICFSIEWPVRIYEFSKKSNVVASNFTRDFYLPRTAVFFY
jgi:hypothetical protein